MNQNALCVESRRWPLLDDTVWGAIHLRPFFVCGKVGGVPIPVILAIFLIINHFK